MDRSRVSAYGASIRHRMDEWEAADMAEPVTGRAHRERDVVLPPGQYRIDGFPRFGAQLDRPPPEAPDDPRLEITGAVTTPTTVALAELGSLPHREIVADLHCVAGWSATGLRWGGVPFTDLYRTRIEPSVRPGTTITHVVFEGLDGYRSVALLDDVLADDVLLAVQLDGRPLGPDHGAPLRLVSPAQYGFMSTKHLCRIEVCATEPHVRYHPSPRVHLGLQMVKPHPRARVAYEERHRYLPAWLVRPAYHRLVPAMRRRRVPDDRPK
jgi:DMSO/TMAO reductase YedYZ molybdopterin-dependent catalytic subunit